MRTLNLLLLAFVLMTAAASAHEGHDHSAEDHGMADMDMHGSDHVLVESSSTSVHVEQHVETHGSGASHTSTGVRSVIRVNGAADGQARPALAVPSGDMTASSSAEVAATATAQESVPPRSGFFSRLVQFFRSFFR